MNFDVKAAIESLKAYKYTQGQIFNTTGIDKMSCYHREREMEELRRCGCNECREKYYHMERDYYRDRSRRDYYQMPSVLTPRITAVDYTKEIKVTPIEEPKNYAVKLLVDQLKAQQINLDGKKSAIDSQKNQIKIIQTAMKNNNTEKLGIENKIKELSVALKKLGHKE